MVAYAVFQNNILSNFRIDYFINCELEPYILNIGANVMFKVVKLKDIIKILFIMIIIYFLGRIIFNNNNERVEAKVDEKKESFLALGLNYESTFIKKVVNCAKDEEEKTEDMEQTTSFFEPESIFKTASVAFRAEKKEENIGQDDKNTSKENVAQENIQNQDVDQNQAVEVVTPNPIAENYNREFNGIKIKNGTSYELTDDMLNPNNLEINNKNVLIFHTHTCESYTESEDYKYIPSRKF